jgi:hypothetical protein
MSVEVLKWPGLSAENTLVINVDKQVFGIKPDPLEYDGKIFLPKQEAHITVFGSEIGTELLRQFVQNPEIEHRVQHAFESTDWTFTTTSELRHLVRTRATANAEDCIEETIIRLVKMQGMNDFYRKLKQLCLIAKDHPVPPPHVTLYTRNIDRGIGVDSEAQLAQLSLGSVDIEL